MYFESSSKEWYVFSVVQLSWEFETPFLATMAARWSAPWNIGTLCPMPVGSLAVDARTCASGKQRNIKDIYTRPPALVRRSSFEYQRITKSNATSQSRNRIKWLFSGIQFP